MFVKFVKKNKRVEEADTDMYVTWRIIFASWKAILGIC